MDTCSATAWEKYRGLPARLAEAVRAYLADSPGCHDWDHTVRVRTAALRLAAAERADAVVVECAALLHDVGRGIEIRDRGKTDHAERGAEETPRILSELGVDDEAFIRHVAECVRTHRYRKVRERPPVTIEAKVVYDADKLDALGAVGLGRAFLFAGREGARLHNTQEEALSAPSYSREDTAWREYLVKLRHLPDSMFTETGRRIARRRLDFMTKFFRRLDDEIHGRDII